MFLRTVNADVELWFLELVVIKPSLALTLRSILRTCDTFPISPGKWGGKVPRSALVLKCAWYEIALSAEHYLAHVHAHAQELCMQV